MGTFLKNKQIRRGKGTKRGKKTLESNGAFFLFFYYCLKKKTLISAWIGLIWGCFGPFQTELENFLKKKKKRIHIGWACSLDSHTARPCLLDAGVALLEPHPCFPDNHCDNFSCNMTNAKFVLNHLEKLKKISYQISCDSFFEHVSWKIQCSIR